MPPPNTWKCNSFALHREVFCLRVMDDDDRGRLLGGYEAFNPDFTKTAERVIPCACACWSISCSSRSVPAAAARAEQVALIG